LAGTDDCAHAEADLAAIAGRARHADARGTTAAALSGAAPSRTVVCFLWRASGVASIRSRRSVHERHIVFTSCAGSRRITTAAIRKRSAVRCRLGRGLRLRSLSRWSRLLGGVLLGSSAFATWNGPSEFTYLYPNVCSVCHLGLQSWRSDCADVTAAT